MSRALNWGRPINKRAMSDVIDISDDKSNQPPVKKDAEPLRSKEVLQLEQKVSKLEKDKHHLLDRNPAPDVSDNKLVQELLNKIHELSNDRDELARKLTEADEREKKLAEAHQNKIDEITKHRDELVNTMCQSHVTKSALQTRIDELTGKIAESEQLHMENQKKINDLSNECDRLTRYITNEDSQKKKLNEEHQKKIDELAHRLIEAGDNERRLIVEEHQKEIDEMMHKLVEAGNNGKRLAEEQQKKIGELALRLIEAGDSEKRLVEQHQMKISELTLKLNQFEDDGQLQLPQNGQLQLVIAEPKKKVETIANSSPSGGTSLANTFPIDHSKNIFKLYHAYTPGAVSIDFAYAELQTVKQRVAACTLGKVQMFERRKEVFKGEALECAICQKTYVNEKILAHFESPCHKVKVSYRDNPHISRTALFYWIDKLKSLTKKPTVAPIMVAPITVAPTVPASHDRASSKKNKKEAKVDE